MAYASPSKSSVGVRELKQQASSIIRRVRESGEVVSITYRGKVVAKLVPVVPDDERLAETLKVWAELDALADEIGTHWPEGQSAAEAVREQRREA